MKNKKISFIVLTIFCLICIPRIAKAANYDLNVSFDGKSNLTMESETPEMSWDLNCLLPGQKDTSTLNIKNTGKSTVNLNMAVSIEEDNGLLEQVDVKVKDKSGAILFDGKYTEIKDIVKNINPGSTETYTVEVGMSVDAGNEYQGKQFTVKFKFVATGDTNTGTLTIRYVDESGKDIAVSEIKSGPITEKYEKLPSIGKSIDGYEFLRVEGSLEDYYKVEGTTVTYVYKKKQEDKPEVKRGNVIVLCVDENNKIIKRTVTTEIVGTEYDLGEVGENIEGYTFMGVEGPTKGKYTVEDIIVIYRYKRNAPTTTVITKPKTGDYIMKYIVTILIISVVLGIVIFLKKNDK